MDKLVNASKQTVDWLDKVVGAVKKDLPQLIYEIHKHYASLKNPDTGRKIVYLHPQNRQIRLFTRLSLTDNNRLQPTPSSSQWADNYPSLFLIKSVGDIEIASELIKKIYSFDR